MSSMLLPEPPDQLLKLRPVTEKPYESRLSSVTCAREINTRLTFSDQGRSRVRALTKGMLDGNPPYSEAQRRAHGLKWTANLNFMESEAAVDSARVPYYDLITGAPTLTDCCTRYRMDDPNWTSWNQKITKHYDWLLKQWDQFYFYTWNEQYWMLVEGWAVNLFDETGWKWRSMDPACVKVPQRSHSCLDERLPYIIVKIPYTITELWDWIKDEESAEALGFDVPLMKQAIMRSDNTMGPNSINWRDQPWEEWQRRMRANDVWAGVTGEEVLICHMYVRELTKPGQKKSVSHFMFTESALGQNDGMGKAVPDDFLRKDVNKFESYDEALNVIFQNTADGRWHSVRGMAQKGFRAWDVNNKLMCKAVDNAFLQSMLILDPVEITDMDKLQLTVKSDVCVLPAGSKLQQLQHAGAIEGALAVRRTLSNMNAENLGVYNQRTISREDGRGEMPTATQVNATIAKEASLTTGQMGLYYLGRDNLYETAFKKAVRSTDVDAMEFKKRCEDDGVPLEALKDMEYVRCNRQAGYGSSQMKKMNIQTVMSIAAMLPEDGKEHLLDDFIAAHAGIDKIERYNPKIQLPTPDMGWATFENGLMHQGEKPLLLPGQDAVQHLQIHLQDAMETLQPIQEGMQMEQSDPQAIAAVLPYVRVLIPHLEEHIAIIAQDPTRKDLAKTFELQIKELVSFSGEMFNILRETQRQNQIAQQQQQQANALGALDQAKLESVQQDNMRKNMKAAADEQRKNMKFFGSERRSNLQTIANLKREGVTTAADIANQTLKTLNGNRSSAN